MGNEQTKGNELNMNGKVSVNGVSANITPNGLEIDANGETIVQQNGGPNSFNLSTESTDYVVVDSDSPHADATVIFETLETITQTKEVKESKKEKVNSLGGTFKKTVEPPADVEIVKEKKTSSEEQTGVSPPATDPQLESGSCGYEATAGITADLRKDQKTETSTQTDRRTDANTSTQTGDEYQTHKAEGPMKEGATMETTATAEDSLIESAAVMTEEVVEVTADVEPSDNQIAGIIIEEVVVINNNVYENIELRVEQMKVTDSFEINPNNNYDPEEETANKTEAEIAAEPEINTNKFSVEGENVDEGHNLEEILPLEMVPESCYIAAVNTMEPGVHEAPTEDNNEGANDLSADVVLTEFTLPESGAVTSEDMEISGYTSLEEEPVHTIMETISEVFCEEPNQTPANQVMPKEEISIHLQVEPANDGATTDEAVAVEDLPEISEELISAVATSNKVIAIEELLRDTLNSSKDKSKSEFILEIITTDKNDKVTEDVMADMRPSTAQETEPDPVDVKDDTEVTLEVATEAALSPDFEPSPITSEVAAVENGISLTEDLITETTFVLLSGELEVNLPIPEKVAEEMNKDTMEDLSKEFDAVPENVKEDTIVQESPPEDLTRKESEESVEVPENVLAQAKTPEPFLVFSEDNPSTCEEAANAEVLEGTKESLFDTISNKLKVIGNIVEEPAEEQADVPQVEATEDYEPCIAVQEFVEANATQTEPKDKSPVISEKPVEASVNPLEQQMLVGICKTTNGNVKDETTHETDNSCKVFAAVDKNSVDSQISTSHEPVAECVEAVLDTTVDNIITEDVKAECNLVNSEEVASGIISERQTEEKAESESNVNLTAIMHSAEIIEDIPATSTDTEDVPDRLQSACTTAAEAISEKLKFTANTVKEPAEEQADVSHMEAPGESLPCISVQKELIAENVAHSAVAVEEPTDSSPVNSMEPVERNVSLLESQERLLILNKTEDEVTDNSTHETDNSDDILAADDKNPADSQISTSDEPVAECVEAVLDTIVEEIITEDVMAECVLVTSEGIAPEITAEGDTEDKAESESNVPQMEVSGGTLCCVSVREELVKENVTRSVIAVEEPTDSSTVSSEETVERNVSLFEPQVLVENFETYGNEATDVSAQKTDNSDDALTAIDKNSEDSQISATDEPLAECVEDVLDTTEEEILTVDVMAECNLVNSEEVATVITAEGENEDKAESESNVPQMEVTGELVPSISAREELVKENVAKSVNAVEEPTDSSTVNSEETVERNVSLFEPQVLVENFETYGNEATDVSAQKTDNSDDALTTIDKNSEDSQISASDEPLAECVEDVLDTIVEEIITEDVMAECVLVTSEGIAPEITAEGNTEDKAESESNVNSTASTQNAEMNENNPVISTDLEAIPVRLQSAFTSLTEATSGRLKEQRDSRSVISEEPVEGKVSLLEPQELVVILKITEDKVTTKSTHESDTSDDVLAAVDKYSVDSQISTSHEPVAECVEAVLDTTVDNIITEDVKAECNLVDSEEVASGIIKDGVTEERAESESNVNSTASTQNAEINEDTPATSTDLEDLPDRLQSACTTAAKAISEKLKFTANTVEEPAEEQADVSHMEAPGESLPCISVQKELIDENIAQSAVAVEEPTDSSPVNSMEPMERNVSLLESQERLLILNKTEAEVTDNSTHETDNSDDILAADDKNSQDSQISTSDEPIAEFVEDVLDTIVEEIITEDVEATSIIVSKSEQPEVTRNIDEEPADEHGDVPQSKATLESVPCISVRNKLEQENVAQSIVIVEEPTDSSPIISEETMEGNVIKTTEDEVTNKSTQEIYNSDDVLATVDKNSEDSQISTSDEQVAVCEELVKENVTKSVNAVEEPTDSSTVNSEETVERNVSLPEPQVVVENFETYGNEATDVSAQKTDNSGDALNTIDKNSEDSQIFTSDEPVAECVEAFLDTIVEEIITEDVMAECNLVNSEEVAPEIIKEGDTEDKAESESNVNSTASTQNAEMNENNPVISTDLEAIPVRLQSAFTSLTEKSLDKLNITEKKVEESADHADVLQMEVSGGTLHWASVQEEQVDERVAQSVVAVEEQTDSSPVISEQPVVKAESESNVNSTASTQNAEINEDTPATSTDLEDLPDRLQSACTKAAEPISEKLEITENIVKESTEEQVDVLQMEAQGESLPYILVQEELVEEKVAKSVAVEELTNSNPVNIEESVDGNVSLLEPQELLVILKTTEDEATERSTDKTENSDDVLAAVDKNSEDSQISTSDEPVAECVEAVLDTTVDDIVTEDVKAECNIVTLEKVTPEIIKEGEIDVKAESDSNVNSTASTQNAEINEDTPATSTDLEDLPDRLQSACTKAAEPISEKLEITENIVKESAEEQVDVLQMEAQGESLPYILVQEELVEEKVAKSVAVEELTNSNPVNIEESVDGNVSLLEPQELLVILKTTEDEATERSTDKTENSDDVLAAVDKNSEDSQISTSDEPVAECVEAVLDTTVDDIITEDVKAECNIVTLEKVTPEIIKEGEIDVKAESDSNVNSTASTQNAEINEDTPATSTDLEDLPDRLQSACTKAAEPISEKLEITENIVKESAEEQVDVLQMEAQGESLPYISVQEELVEEKVAKSVAVEELTDSNPVNIEEPVEGNVSLLEPQELVVILKTTEDKVTTKSTHKTDTFDDVLAAVDKNSKKSHISTSNEPVAECVEAVLETIVEEIITEDVMAECNIVTSEEVVPDIITEGDTEDKAGSKSVVSLKDSTHNIDITEDTPVTSTNRGVLPVRLQSACTTDVEAISEKLKFTANNGEKNAAEQADVLHMDAPGESVPCISVQGEVIDENVAKSVVTVEEPTGSSPVNSEETFERNVSLLEQQELVLIIKTSEDKVTDKPTHETDNSNDVLAAVYNYSEDSQISTSDDPATECVEAVLDTIVEEIITEDVMAECVLVTSEGIAPEITAEGDTEDKAESESNVPQMEVSGGTLCCVSAREELVKENVAKSVIAVEEPTDSSTVNSEESVERNVSLLEQQVLVENFETQGNETTDVSAQKTDSSGNALTIIDKNSEDSQISASNEPVAECVEDGLDAIVDDIITEDVKAECNLVSLEEVPLQIIAEGKTEEKAETESIVNLTPSTQNAEMIEDTPHTSTDMEALLVRLQSACTSVVEKSAFRLNGFMLSSLEYGITVSIHVAPKKKQH